MKKLTGKEIENFLNLIEPILTEYPKEDAEGFRNFVRNPKTENNEEQIKIMMNTLKIAMHLRATAFEDGIITDTEREWLRASRPAVLSQINPIIMKVRAEKEVQLKREATKDAPKKESLAEKIKRFLKNPKTMLIAAVSTFSAPVAATPADEARIDKEEQNRPKIGLNYAPQSFGEAMDEVTKSVMEAKAAKEAEKEAQTPKTKIVPFNENKNNGQGIER